MQPSDREVILTQSRLSILPGVIFGAVLVAAGVWMISAEPDFRAWLVTLGGGALTIAALLQLVRPDVMTINDDGFGRSGSRLGGGYWNRWDEVSPILVGHGRRGFRRGASAIYALVLAPAPPGSNEEPKYSVYSTLPTYGITAAELAAIMNERREGALGTTPADSRQSGDEPPRVVRPPAGATHDPEAISGYFGPSMTNEPLSGSFVQIARTSARTSSIAKRLGAPMVDGTLDGKSVQALVMGIVDVGYLIFVADRIGSRVLMEAGADYEGGREIADTVTKR